MSSEIKTFPITLAGGLVTNVPPVQLGLSLPGAARCLENFEPSISGGYSRLLGIDTWDDNPVPPYGNLVVNGSGQSGTSLTVGNVHSAPQQNDSIEIDGVSGVYFIDAVSYTPANKWATLTLRTPLDSSPADKAAITFDTNADIRIEGLYYFSPSSTCYVIRGGLLYSSLGEGWTVANVPAYGTTLVNGGSQTGSTLAIDGISSDSYVPLAGDVFSIQGVEKVYTVTSDATVTSGACTLSITPALAASPSNNAVVTFLNTTMSSALRASFSPFNFDSNQKFVGVDGTNRPFVVDEAGVFKTLQNSTDIIGASEVVEYVEHLFFMKGDLVTFCSPFLEEDFLTANGAGSYRLRSDGTGFIVFREQLINFTERAIQKLVGTSSSDFRLDSITEDTGCIQAGTIQEVGGDVVYLGPDGVRYLSATERNNDFGLDLTSSPIQSDMTSFISLSGTFSAAVIRKKNQYRIFQYSDATAAADSVGYLFVQYASQDSSSISWSSIKGVKCYLAHSAYDTVAEYPLFVNGDGYVYQMESGNTWNYFQAGVDIPAKFYTPFLSLEDPLYRKVLYATTVYYDPTDAFAGTLTTKFDLESASTIQPPVSTLTGVESSGVYSGLRTIGVGSFDTISLEYSFSDSGPPFTLDTILVEYSVEDRK